MSVTIHINDELYTLQDLCFQVADATEGQRALELTEALQAACERMIRDSLRTLSLSVYRPASAKDVIVSAESVVNLIDEGLAESDELSDYTGGAVLPWVDDSPEAAALQIALSTYIAKHVDVRCSPLQQAPLALTVTSYAYEVHGEILDEYKCSWQLISTKDRTVLCSG